ncbi:RagB/SusD family nutrient uptake outer membrane protein [Flaviramulus multivorans]
MKNKILNKMTRKIYMLLLTMSLIVTYSCTETYLDTAPTDSISEVAAFSNPDNMELVINGLHRQMYASVLNGGGTPNGESYFMPALDFISGEVIHTGPGFNWMKGEARWLSHTNANSTVSFDFWYQRYHFIATTNALINNVASKDFTVTPQLNSILGQAHAYRAWSYWRLVTTFSKGYLIGNPSTDPGVPITNGLSLTEGAPRGTVEQVYNQIETDIDAAIGYLTNASAPPNKSYISLNAAYGIKARIALSKGDWAAAATNAALARNGFPLFNEAEWHAGFNSVDQSEVIWASRIIDTESNFFASYFYYISFMFNGGECRGNNKIINIELYNQIPATDHRNKAWLPMAPNTNSAAYNGQGGSYLTDPNYNDAASFNAAKAAIIAQYGATPAHNTHPYMNVKFKQSRPGTNNPDDVIYMRSSEMVLIEAEAKAMMNDISGAQDALDILGSSRDTAFDKTAFGTQQALMDQIKFQRRVELWGEGFGYHDKIRWDEGIDQTNSGASLVIYGDAFIQERPSVNDDWIFKIPQQEIDSNPLITEADQN